MSGVAFVVAVLATLRLSLLISQEEGPFSAFARLRAALDPDQRTWLGRGLNCAWCVSFWVALPVTALVTVLGYADAWAWLPNWWAVSGGVVLLKRWMDKGR